MKSDTSNDGRLLNDLRVYLQQQYDAGLECFFDPGTTMIPEAVSSTQAALPAAVPGSKEEVFQKMCDEFVRLTLARIAEDTSSTAQGGLFNGQKDAEPTSVDDRREALSALKVEIDACKNCKLHTSRTNTVFGAGRADSGIVFIGEAPGHNEDLEGQPFVGRSGKLLTDILGAIGFAREDVFICNILKCRPPANRNPERDEIVACESFLKRQIDILQPRVICCLGLQAARALLETRKALKDLRKTIHFYNGVPVMATYHPAALLRNPNWKRPAWDDVRKLRALYDALT